MHETFSLQDHLYEEPSQFDLVSTQMEMSIYWVNNICPLHYYSPLALHALWLQLNHSVHTNVQDFSVEDASLTL